MTIRFKNAHLTLLSLATILCCATGACTLEAGGNSTVVDASSSDAETETFDATAVDALTFVDGNILFEAEDATEIVAPMAVFTSGQASGGLYITTTAAGLGTASFVFEVRESNTYYVWIRIFTLDSQANSIYYAMDSDPEQQITNDTSNQWYWDGLVIPSYMLDPGMHELRFRGRETDFRFDQLLITTDAANPPAVLQ